MGFSNPLSLSIALPDGQIASQVWVQARGPVNVIDYGVTAGDTDATATANGLAFAQAVTAAKAQGRGVYIPGPAVYRTDRPVPIASGVAYTSDGATLKLASGANCDLMQTEGVDALWAGSTQGGPVDWSISRLRLDGNRAGQTAGPSYPLRVYGARYALTDVTTTGGYSGGFASRWGVGGTNMEARITNLRVFNNGFLQLDWQGPHDSQFSNLVVFTDNAFHGGLIVPGSRGVRLSGNAAGEQITNAHVWGFHEVGFELAAGVAQVFSGVAEGAGVNVLFSGAGDTCSWDGTVFGTNGSGPYAVAHGGPGEVGVQIGVSGSGKTNWSSTVRGSLWNWAAGDKPILFDADNGNAIDVVCRTAAATAPTFGPRSFKSTVTVLDPNNARFSERPGAFSGTGVPNASLGVDGSTYIRRDGAAGSRQYYRDPAAGWVPIL